MDNEVVCYLFEQDNLIPSDSKTNFVEYLL